MSRRTEILAPAGSFTSLKASFKAGADAVYAGGSRFGARAYAGNFDQEEMLRAIDYAHLRDKKLYLTLNTLVKERELEAAVDFLRPFYEQGLDAVIVQDLGVLYMVEKYYPELPIHLSTQMNVTDAWAIDSTAFKMPSGRSQITRIVPARELTLDEIKKLKKGSGLEIEVFVHGALCYCYSGQCLFSSMKGDRSGNRGHCAQICRKKFSLGGNEVYLLSPKDICTLGNIPELIEAGVDSFKIEGRMKSPEYAAGVSRAYADAVGLYEELGREGYHEFFKEHAEDREKIKISLMDLFNRGGFSKGYAFTKPGPEMMALTRPNHNGVFVGKAVLKNGIAYLSPETALYPGDVLEIRDESRNDWYSYTLPSESGTIHPGEKTISFRAYPDKRENPVFYREERINDTSPVKGRRRTVNGREPGIQQENFVRQGRQGQNRASGFRQEKAFRNSRAGELTKTINKSIYDREETEVSVYRIRCESLLERLKRNYVDARDQIEVCGKITACVGKPLNLSVWKDSTESAVAPGGPDDFMLRNDSTENAVAPDRPYDFMLRKDSTENAVASGGPDDSVALKGSPVRDDTAHGNDDLSHDTESMPVSQKNGEKLFLTETEGEIVEAAKSAPTTESDILSKILRSGDSDFVFEKLDSKIEDGVFIPKSRLGELRRRALEELEKKIIQRYRRKSAESEKPGGKSVGEEFPGENDHEKQYLLPVNKDQFEKVNTAPVNEEQFTSVHITVANEEQFTTVLDSGTSDAIVFDETLFEKESIIKLVKQARKSHPGTELFLKRPHIAGKEGDCFTMSEIADAFDGVYVNNPAQLNEACAFKKSSPSADFAVFADENLYVANHLAAQLLTDCGADAVTISHELERNEIEDLSQSLFRCRVPEKYHAGERNIKSEDSISQTGQESGIRTVFDIYGRQQLMISRQCIKKSLGRCERKKGWSFIKDEDGRSYPVHFDCGRCLNRIFDSRAVDMTGLLPEIRKFRPFVIRVNLTCENEAECREVLMKLKDGLNSKKKENGGNAFYGHYYSGVK